MSSPIATALAVYPELAPFVLDEWRAHFADDFAALALTPSLPMAGQCQAFRDDRAAFTLEAVMAHALGTDSAEQRQRFYAHTMAGGALRSSGAPVFLRKAFLAEQVKHGHSEEARAAAAAELASLAGVDTPKAAEVRSALNGVLKRLFGGKLASEGGGDWGLGFEWDGVAIKLGVDTGGMGRGFRYEFRPPRRPGTPAPTWFNYETLLGLPNHGWDGLRTDRLDAQIALWASRLERMLPPMRTVRWLDAGPAARAGCAWRSCARWRSLREVGAPASRRRRRRSTPRPRRSPARWRASAS